MEGMDLIALAKELSNLRDRVEALEKENAALKAKNAKLERRLAKSSKNSSKPPSTDSPQARSKRKKRRKSPRSQGAQPGHPPHERSRLTPDETIHILPSQCAHCDHHLSGEDASPRTHQFVDIPPITPHVIDYILHDLDCSQCGNTTRAKTPAHVGKRTYGDGIVSITSMLTGSFRISKRQTKRLLSKLLGIEVSLGSVSHFEHVTSTSLEPAYQEASQALRASEVAHCDETTWWHNRSKSGLHALFGFDWEGTLISDRMGVYLHRDKGKGQRCLAHLLRDFEGLSERDGPLGETADKIANGLKQLFRFARWHRQGEDALLPLTRAELVAIGECWKPLLLEELVKGAAHADAPGWYHTLQEDWEQLWTWLSDERVAMTNNLAERKLRPLVIARKTSFGTESERGDRFIERIYTVAQTLADQGRDLLSFLRDSLATLHSPALPPKLIAP
jgi:transposase